MARMTGFVFQDEYLERLAKLSDQEVGRLVRALATYHATGEAPELAGREGIAFDFIKVDVDRIDQKYVARCETNRDNRQRLSTIVNDGPRIATIDPQDKVKDKDKVNNNTAATHAREDSHSYQHTEIGDLVSANLRAMSGKAWDDLRAFMAEMPADLIRWAILDSVDHGGNTWAYVRKVLCSLQEAGITTVEEAEKRSESYRQAKRGGGRIAQTNYEQRDYEERPTGQLPAFIREMMEEEAAAQ